MLQGLASAQVPASSRAHLAQQPPVEVLEAVFAHLDALSLHFAARTCRTWYWAAQRTQAAQCQLYRVPRGRTAATWHAQHSALARIEARWLLGLVQPHSASAAPQVHRAPVFNGSITFAHRHLVVREGAIACILGASGQKPRAFAAAAPLVDIAGRADGGLLSLTPNELCLHHITSHSSPHIRAVPHHHQRPLSLHTAPLAAVACVRGAARVAVYRVPSLAHAYDISGLASNVMVDTLGDMLVIQDQDSNLAAFAAATGAMVWRCTLPQGASVAIVGTHLVICTPCETSLWSILGARLATFGVQPARASFVALPTPMHMLATWPDAHDVNQTFSAIMQVYTGEILDRPRRHEGLYAAVSADGALLALRCWRHVTFTSMRPQPRLLTHL